MAESIFNNKLHAGLLSLVPNISPDLVTKTGASNLAKVFSGSDLAGVIAAYIQGLNATWLAGVALAAVSFLIAVLAPIKKAAAPPKPELEVAPLPAAPGSSSDGSSDRLGTSGQESKRDEKDDDTIKERDLVSRG